MAFPSVIAAGTEGYIRANFAGNAEAESIQDYLNHMHPLVATAHALFRQESTDSILPTVLMDDLPIDRTASSAANMLTATRASGEAVEYNVTTADLTAPSRLANRTQIFSEGIAASRTSQRIRLYGIEDTMDRAIDKALAKVLDLNERALHFGIGDATNADPFMHGLMGWTCGTGLERSHYGVAAAVGDGINAVDPTYFGSFYNGLGTPLSRDLLYDQVFSNAWQIGHVIDGSILLCGNQMIKIFADMPRQSGRTALNERTIPARDQALSDVISVIDAPAYGTFYLMADRIMSIPGVVLDFANGAYGAPRGGNGNIAAPFNTINVDQTVLSIMTSELCIKAIDNISYRELASDGDYTAGMVYSEKTLELQHNFAIVGGGNLNT